jgi:hypothetical protein
MVPMSLRDELNERNVLMLIQIFRSIKFGEELFLNAFIVEEASRLFTNWVEGRSGEVGLDRRDT